MDSDADLPNGRWVLWDKNGNPIDARVSPYVADIPTRFGEADFSCIYLETIDAKRIRLIYDLKTGIAEKCEYTVSYDDWKFASYLDSSCAGTPYQITLSPGSYPGIGYQSEVVKVAGKFYYWDGEPDVENFLLYYTLSGTTCVKHDAPTGYYGAWVYKAVPDWVLNILPNAPYTLTMEY